MIEAAVGVRKSVAAICTLTAFLDADPERRVAYMCPEHRLADEVIARINAAAGRTIARSWRGMTQADPDELGATMCRRHDDVKDFLAASGRLERVCGGPWRGACRHHPDNLHRLGSSCAHTAQRNAAPRVWMIPFSMLASALPKTIRWKDRVAFDLIVLDDWPWLSLLGGCDQRYAVPPEHFPDNPAGRGLHVPPCDGQAVPWAARGDTRRGREMRRRLLDERGVEAGVGTLWRFFKQREISLEKRRATRPGGRARTSTRQGWRGSSICARPNGECSNL